MWEESKSVLIEKKWANNVTNCTFRLTRTLKISNTYNLYCVACNISVDVYCSLWPSSFFSRLVKLFCAERENRTPKETCQLRCKEHIGKSIHRSTSTKNISHFLAYRNKMGTPLCGNDFLNLAGMLFSSSVPVAEKLWQVTLYRLTIADYYFYLEARRPSTVTLPQGV